MKVKRVKKATKILMHYQRGHGFSPPYSVLVDGTFCQAALQAQINLREQMPKYLSTPVEILSTSCIVHELETLAAECIMRLAKRGASRGTSRTSSPTNPHKYMVATQDEALLEQLREAGGIPLMSIRYNAILLEKPSARSMELLEAEISAQSKSELTLVRGIKRVVLNMKDDEDCDKKGKKRKKRGVNPLSCKKKKPKTNSITATNSVPGAFGRELQQDNTQSHGQSRTAKRRRKRKAANLTPEVGSAGS